MAKAVKIIKTILSVEFEGFHKKPAIDTKYLSRKTGLSEEEIELAERFLFASKLFVYGESKIYADNLIEFKKLLKNSRIPKEKLVRVLEKTFKKWREETKRNKNIYLKYWYLPTRTPLSTLVDFQEQGIDFLKIFKEELMKMQQNANIRRKVKLK